MCPPPEYKMSFVRNSTLRVYAEWDVDVDSCAEVVVFQVEEVNQMLDEIEKRMNGKESERDRCMNEVVSEHLKSLRDGGAVMYWEVWT